MNNIPFNNYAFVLLKPRLRPRQSKHRRAWQHALCWLLVALLILTAAGPVVAADDWPCLWSRCQKRAFQRYPQLCPEHLRRPNTTAAGERLVAMIWAGDTAGIAKLAPVADPDAWITGLPPLGHAIMADRPESAQALLDAGAWPEFRDPAGENLAAYAARRGKPRMVAFFLSKGIGSREDVENVPRGGMEDFRRDDRRYEQERLKAEGAAQVIEELFKRDVERDTGYRPKRGLRDMWSDVEKAMSAYSASTPTAPANQPAPTTPTSPPSNNKTEPAPMPRLDQPATQPGERYPQTRIRLMSEDEVASWSVAQLRYAINEMYARHGLYFRSDATRKQFQQFNWYEANPNVSTETIESRFTEIERANSRLLGQIRDSRQR